MGEQTMRFVSKLPMIDIEREDWRTSWAPTSCWNAASQIDRDTATRIEGLQVADSTQAILSEIEQPAPAFPGVLKKGHSVVDNCSVSGKWLVDTGCAHDLIPDSKAADYPKCLFQETPHEFSTANGETASTVRMNIKIPAIECKTSACLLPDTPAVLTVGGRAELGYSFVWIAGILMFILTVEAVSPFAVENS